MKFYAGIGSRSTPADVLALMERVAAWLAAEGWTLRSGHAAGADRAFERGAAGKAVVYLPWAGFGTRPYNGDPGCPVLGEAICHPPEWLANYAVLNELGIHGPQTVTRGVKDRCRTVKDSIRALHGRNFAQVLGHGHTDGGPLVAAKMVICWCPVVDGRPQGGTATAVLLARHHGIPVFNLAIEEDRQRVEDRIR